MHYTRFCSAWPGNRRQQLPESVPEQNLKTSRAGKVFKKSPSVDDVFERKLIKVRFVVHRSERAVIAVAREGAKKLSIKMKSSLLSGNCASLLLLQYKWLVSCIFSVIPRAGIPGSLPTLPLPPRYTAYRPFFYQFNEIAIFASEKSPAKEKNHFSIKRIFFSISLLVDSDSKKGGKCKFPPSSTLKPSPAP
jgi:hypothetical protein